MPSSALHSTTLSLSGYADTEQASLRRRRLGEAVAKRLMRSSNAVQYKQTRQVVADQAKMLYSRYLRARLRSVCPTSSAAYKKLGLQRLKSLAAFTTSASTIPDATSYDVVHEIRELGKEMERLHPELFGSVLENVGMKELPPLGVLQILFRSLAEELFKDSVTWGRLVALFALAGGLSLDCVKHGRTEYVLCLVQDVGNCVERDNVADFIIGQGGWSGLLTKFKKKTAVTSSELWFFGSLMMVLLIVIAALLHLLSGRSGR